MTKYGDLVKLPECEKCIYNASGIRCIDYIKGKIQIQILEKGEPVINQTRVKGECSTTKEDLENRPGMVRRRGSRDAPAHKTVFPRSRQ